MKKLYTVVTVVSLAAALAAATVYAAGDKTGIGIIGGADGPTQIYIADGTDGTALKRAVERLEDLVDDMEDARTDEKKAALQAEIDALIGQYPALEEFIADYTTMTKQELKAVEDKLDALEDALKKSVKGRTENGIADSNKENSVPAERVTPILPNGTDNTALKRAVERLEDLVDDMEDARTDEKKAALQAEIDALIEQYSALEEFIADYTSMTKQELEAVEDKLDALEDALKKSVNGRTESGIAGSNKENSVPAERVTPILPDGTDNTALKRAVERLEDLVDDMEDARTDEKKAALQAEIDALIEQYSALEEFIADYTSMTKQELEAVEDKLDALEDILKKASKIGENNGGTNNRENSVPAEKILPILPEGTDNAAMKKLVGQLEDLVDDMGDARTDEKKAALQAKIDALIEQYPALGAFAADYTTMTKQELEAVEDKLDALEDIYSERHRSGILGSGRNDENNEVVSRLKALKEELRNARSASEKAEIIAQIKELVSSGTVHAKSAAAEAEGRGRNDETETVIPLYEVVLDFEEVKGDNE